MRVRSALGLVAAIGLAATSLTGCSTISDILAGGGVQEFEVGQCLDSDGVVAGDGQSEVGQIPVVDCADAHDAEVYYTSDTTATDFDLQGLIDESDALCHEQFETYVGLDYESSSIYYATLYPSQESWDAGDRELVCLLSFDTDVTESYKGSGV